MGSSDSTFLEMAVQLATRLPTDTVRIVARAIEESPGPDSPVARTRIAQNVPQPYYRDIATDFITYWRLHASHLSPREVALALLVAEQADVSYKKSQSVELVWTGPDAEVVPFRRTEQAILV